MLKFAPDQVIYYYNFFFRFYTNRFWMLLVLGLIGIIFLAPLTVAVLEEDTLSEQYSEVTVECEVPLGLSGQNNVEKARDKIVNEWTAETKDARVILTREGMCGDQCFFVEKIILTGLLDKCPQFISARVSHMERGSDSVEVIKTKWAQTGSLKIQDWNYIGGIIRGRLISDIELNFHVNTIKK